MRHMYSLLIAITLVMMACEQTTPVPVPPVDSTDAALAAPAVASGAVAVPESSVCDEAGDHDAPPVASAVPATSSK